MTLQEAIETGLPFRRPSWKTDWNGCLSWVKANGNFLCFVSSGSRWTPHVVDICAADFIVKRELYKGTLKKTGRDTYEIDFFGEEPTSGIEFNFRETEV